MNKYEYKKYADSKADKSPLLKNMFFAFMIGGLICVLGQLITDGYIMLDFSKKDAQAMTSITLVFLSALTTALGWYDNLAKLAGAGTLVPITGFANAVVAPAIEFKDEGYVLGVAANIFKIAGPVITYGILASVIAGLIFLF